MPFNALALTTDEGAATVTVPQKSYTFAPTAGGVVRYLATTGSDTGLGTLGSPWKTFAHALPLLNAGDVLFVRVGTYEEPWLFTRSGTASAPITISAYPGETVVIAQPLGWQAANIHGATVEIAGNYVTLHGFEIRGCRGQAGAPAPDTYNQNAVSLRYGVGLKILNNVCHHAQHCGIKGGQASLLEGNVCFDNGISQNDHGIYNGNPDMVFRGNACFRNTGWGFHLYAAPTGQTLYNNLDFENGMGGVLVAGAFNTVAYHVSTRNTNGGLWWFRQGCHDNTFRNLVLFDNASSQVAFDQGGGAPGSQPLNNTLNDSDASPATSPTWYSNSLVLTQTGEQMTHVDPLVETLDPLGGVYDLRLSASSPLLGTAAPLTLNGLSGTPPDPGLFDTTYYTEPTWGAPTTQTYFLDPAGIDTAAGTEAAPWKTLAHAQTVMAPGDTLLMRGGTYTETVVWTRSGTATQPITIRAYGTEVPVLTTASTAAQKNQLTLLTLSGCQYVTVIGLSIEGVRAKIATSPAGARKQYCVELAAGGGRGVKLLNCRLYHGLAGGFQDSLAAASYRIEGCLVYNNGLNANDPALRVQGRAMVLRGNGIFSNTGTGIQAVTTTNTNPNAPVVYGNLLFGNGGHGIAMSGINGKFAYNVCHANTLRGFQLVQQYATGNVVENSILWANLQNQVGADSNAPVTGNTVDHNLIYPAAAPSWSQNGVARGYDGGHNLFTQPQVTNVSQHDYRLTAGAAGDDAAGSVTLNGLARVWPDIGLVPATEFTEPVV